MIILEEQRLAYIQMRTLGYEFGNWSDVGNFQESGNLPIVMHLLKKLDNHSDIMQLAILKNLDGMSLGELLDFILKFSF